MDNSSEWQHSEGESSFWGTFTTIKVMKAIEKDYKALEIHEVWHFENTLSDLLSKYVNYFLRLTQESLGIPDWVQTPEDQAKYIDEYYKHEGVFLRRDKIIKNPGLRAFAKLCHNSLWGVFCNVHRQVNDRVHYNFINGLMEQIQKCMIIVC